MSHSPLRLGEMHSEQSQLSEHLRQFGLIMFGSAIRGVVSTEMSAPFLHAMSLVQAAHGAELVIKARIAQEHPLMIFDRLPTKKKAVGSLSLEHLVEFGQTIAYPDLPERLWATTGVRMERETEFLRFGRVRNVIQHLGVPVDRDLAETTLRFAFNVMEPMVQGFWGQSVAEELIAYEYEEDVLLPDLGERLFELKVASGPFVDRALAAFHRRVAVEGG